MYYYLYIIIVSIIIIVICFGNYIFTYYIHSVQPLSRVWLFASPWTTAQQSSHHQLLQLAQTHVHRVGDAIQPSHPLLSPSPPTFNISQHRVFSDESVLHIRWPSIGASASASVLPMNIQDWFPLGLIGWTSLQSKGLSSLLQHHSSKASILRCSAFFIVKLSHPFMTTGKTIALTRCTFVGKVMSAF